MQPTVEKVGDNVFVRGVAVFDEHSDPSRHGVMKQVDAKLLGQFVENTNRRLVSEYELPLAAGWHTPKPGELHVPPPVKGGYRNLRLDDFTDANGTRKAVYADLRIPVGEWDGVSSLQRRSIEAFPDTKEFDTLCLLGSKAPARDLGRMTPAAMYARDGREVVRYEMDAAPELTESTQETDMSPEDLQAIIAGVTQAIGPAVKAALDEAIQGEDAQEANPEGDDDMDGIVNADDSSPEGEDATGLAVQEPEQYERLRMEDHARKTEQYEKRIKALEAKAADADRRADSEHYTLRLTELRDQGIELERDKELARLMGMKTETARSEHLKTIKENYRRDPTFESSAGREAVQYERQTPGSTDPKGVTPELANRIAEYAAKNGCGWDAGRAAVMGTNGKA